MLSNAQTLGIKLQEAPHRISGDFIGSITFQRVDRFLRIIYQIDAT